MRQLEERVGADVDERAAVGAVGEHGHDQQRDLVGDHVADRPTRQAQHGEHGRMSPRGQEAQVRVQARQRRQERERHHHHARGRPQADEQDQTVVVEHAAHGERPVGDPRKGEEHCDDDDVVEDRCERGSEEATARVEHRGREGDDAVEQHLRHEEAEQVGRQLLLGGDVRPVHVQRVQVDDPRRGDDADDGDPRQREHRDGEDRARRVVVARFEVLHEQRDEGRGQHPAEEQLVDDVGRLVRVAVGAGEGRGAERVRDGRDAHEAGDAGERGADGDDRARPDEGGLGLGGIGARLGEPDVVGAHVFTRAARWASRPGTKGGAPASASGAAGGCPSPTRWRGTRSRPRSGRLPHR